MVEMCEVEPACAWWLRQLELYISAQLVVYSPTNFCTSFEGDSVGLHVDTQVRHA
jgi:hypothetical protein